MKILMTAALVSVLGISVAFAAEDQNMTGKAKSEHPGTSQPGATTAPTAKPDAGSLSAKQKQSEPGVNSNSGTTTNPGAKPSDDYRKVKRTPPARIEAAQTYQWPSHAARPSLHASGWCRAGG